jgi:hypothetical protein
MGMGDASSSTQLAWPTRAWSHAPPTSGWAETMTGSMRLARTTSAFAVRTKCSGSKSRAIEAMES